MPSDGTGQASVDPMQDEHLEPHFELAMCLAQICGHVTSLWAM